MVSSRPEAREAMERCVAVLRPACRRWPQDWQLHHRLGQCLTAMGSHAAAREAGLACLAAAPNEVACVGLVAGATHTLAGEDAALPWYERWAALDAAEGRFTIAWERLVSNALRHEDIARARARLDEAWPLATTPHERARLARLESSLAALTGDPAAALEFSERAVKLSGTSAEQLASHVFALLRLGMLDAARPVIEQALRAGPGPIDRECLEWARSVLAGTADATALGARTETMPHHRLFLLLALDAHLHGKDDAACRILDAAHRHPGKPLLHPTWLPGCKMPNCRLPRERP